MFTVSESGEPLAIVYRIAEAAAAHPASGVVHGAALPAGDGGYILEASLGNLCTTETMTDAFEGLRTALGDRYHIHRELGRGGMAIVYLADDLKHERKVALKVLRPELSAMIGGERFLKEVRVIASLQHPHVLPLFDSGSADGLLFYVMPYVDGDSLRGRLLGEGQLGIEEALRISAQVASALEHAHRHGVVHRDIKPENILLAEGHALVADFGIALAVSTAAEDRLTETGLLLGTPQYMSPEQSTGDRRLDARTDIYSLACVLYEMLAGVPPYTGPTAQAVMVKIMTERPPAVTVFRETTPPTVVAALHKALSRLPADRFAHAAEFAAALVSTREPAGAVREGSTPGGGAGLLTRLRGRWSVAWIGVAMMAILAAAAGVLLMRSADAAGDLVYFKFDVPAQQLSEGIFSRFALSPDGRTLVYAGADDRLYLQRLDSPDAIAVRASEGAVAASFSPDGQWLVYSQGNAVRKHAIHGDASVPITQQHARLGASWSRDGSTILMGAGEAFLRQVSAEGGEIKRIAFAGDSGTTNYVWPQALPVGDAVLFTALGPSGTAVDSRIILHDLRTGERHVVVQRAMYGRYIRMRGSEYLLYALSDGTVLAAPFSLRRKEVTGPAFAVLSDVQVAVLNGAALFAVAHNGTLAFVRGNSTNLQLLKWVDRTGRELGTLGPPITATGGFPDLALSRDGRRVALTRRTPGSNNLWLMDTASGQLEPLTLGPNEDETAVWSPDGRSFAYASTREGGRTWLYMKSLDGPSDAKHIYSATSHGHLSSWSPDGRWLLLSSSGILAVRSDGEETQPVVAQGSDGQFSPDGRWIAFTSNQSGREEVYVIAFPQNTGKQQVSIDGGRNPRWAPDGSTLYYRQGRSLMAAPASLRPSFNLGPAQKLFEADLLSFEVAPDGQRFLLLAPNPEANRGEIHVVVNWFKELKERAKAAGR
jgi:eukaryotic-like serine/threonine-protein kinase